jgi:hypothetical protein
MRSESRRPALQILRKSLLEFALGRRLTLVRETGLEETEPLRNIRERLPEEADDRRAGFDQGGAERRHLRCPGGDRAPPAPFERRVPLCKRRCVVRREMRPCRKRSAERSVEVRTPSRRSGFHDRKPIRGEDERGGLASQLLCCPQPRPVHLCPLPVNGRERETHLDRRLAPASREPDLRRLSSEADQLRVGPRAGREPLRADVKRLEQIGLAGAVGTDREHEAG